VNQTVNPWWPSVADPTFFCHYIAHSGDAESAAKICAAIEQKECQGSDKLQQKKAGFTELFITYLNKMKK
jgi:hypothetical protein